MTTYDRDKMPEYCDALLQELVGDQGRIDAFRTTLTDEYWTGMSQVILGNADPYSTLEYHAKNIVEDATQRVYPYVPGNYDENTTLLYGNAELGIETTISTLRMVGDAYVRNVQVPQYREVVARNVGTALRHLYGVAYSDLDTGEMNLEAFFRGANPSDRLPYYFRHAMRDVSDFEVKATATDSFVISMDDAGQLDLGIRYKRVLENNGAHCPAVESRINVAGEPPSALLTLMKTIGDVVIGEVYPLTFDIVDAPAQPAHCPYSN